MTVTLGDQKLTRMEPGKKRKVRKVRRKEEGGRQAERAELLM